MANNDLVAACSDPSLHKLPAAISRSNTCCPPLPSLLPAPHQPPAAHATAILFCHSSTTLLSLFFPCYSGVGNTAAAFCFNRALLCSNRALLCLFFPLHSCTFVATASTTVACRQPPSLPAAHTSESLDRKENPLEKEKYVTDLSYPRIRVDFPRWEGGDPTEWTSHVERYFAQWYNWNTRPGLQGSLMRSCRSRPRDMELSLEDTADLKKASLLGP
ncbi:hypothetical protein BHM03_00018961 [Ensete ventricosum]|nr:hypothetical protein BHM03_00018961 [Ensete ventricosum]